MTNEDVYLHSRQRRIAARPPTRKNLERSQVPGMSRSNAGNALSLASPPAIHVGPIVTGPGSNETISIVIPLSNAHLTTMANQQKIDKNCKDCGKDTKQQATTAANPTRRCGVMFGRLR